MGLFSFGTSEKPEERGLSVSTEAAFAAGMGNMDAATPQSSLNLSAVYSAMYVISSALGQLPLHVMRRSGPNVELINDHPASNLLRLEPNKWQTSYKWRETEQFRLLGWGNAYTRIVRRRGKIVEFKPLAPWITYLSWREFQGGRRYFYVTTDTDTGAQEVVQLEDMIHLKDVSYDEKTGVSRIRQHADSIGWGLSMQEYGKSFFGSNGRPTGAVAPKEQLNEDSWNKFKSMWAKAGQAMMGSSTNRTMLLPAELTYQSFTIPPEDMQFLDSRKFSRSEIAGIFNLPPHMIGDLEKATFSNISEQALQFVKYTMMPWVVSWEQEITRKLFTAVEREAGYYVKFNLSALLRGTPKDRGEFLKYMVEAGIYSRNEARAMEDRNPLDGLDDMVISQNVKSVKFMDAEAEIKVKEAQNGNGKENI